jgi:hypothetical protein
MEGVAKPKAKSPKAGRPSASSASGSNAPRTTTNAETTAKVRTGPRMRRGTPIGSTPNRDPNKTGTPAMSSAMNIAAL